MIKRLEPSTFPLAAEVVRASFATVAKDFGLTSQNCPMHTSFSTTAERLGTHHRWGWFMYGLYEGERLIGYVSLSKEADGVYELHNLAILPEYRQNGYGNLLLDHCIAAAKELGGDKIILGIIEENSVLKNWYVARGFTHLGTKKFDHLPFTSGYMKRIV